MKELTIEEKAELYDEIVRKLKNALNDGTISSNTFTYLQYIFSEFEEIKNEKIKKALKEVIIEYDMWSEKGLLMCDVLDWVKNQGKLWKPSKEQMEYLYKYAEQNNYDGAILTSLYKDLKQL